MKNFLKRVGLVLAIVVLIYFILALWPRGFNYTAQNPMRTDRDLSILIAHGGGNKELPDNTLEAFYNAYNVDPRVMMETDVSVTKDGVVLLSHDTTLDRKTNVTGAIADWNYADLMAQKVNFGYTNPTKDGVLSGDRVKFTTKDGKEVTPLNVEYPAGVVPRDEEVFLATTLEDLLIAFPETRINVEIKQEGDLGLKCLKAVMELLDKHDAWDRVVLASFHEELYDEYQRLQFAKEVPDIFMYSPAYDAVTEFVVLEILNLDLFFDDGMCVFQLPMEEYGIDLATKKLVDTAHKHNMAVHYWTINDPEEMRRLIEIGADGIMTDYPHLLQEVYDSYGE
jgi:glycerophosphoryl diester phosphodiesterase